MHYAQRFWSKNLGLSYAGVFIVAAYDENSKPCCMNAAWGGIYDTNQIMVCLADDHKTTKNILASKAFTVSIADAKHVTEADYVGIVSGNKVPDKMEKAGLTTVKSAFVNAPVINEFPMTIECNLLKFNEDGICIGEIVVYAYLMYCEGRKTFQCHPRYKTIGNAVGLGKNTVKKHINGLIAKQLITTAPTTVITKKGQKHNGTLFYTIRPIQEAVEYHYQQQPTHFEVEMYRQMERSSY